MKKFSVLLLAALIIFTGSNCTMAEKSPVAENNPEVAIEPLISKVKNVFSISDDYEDFNVSQQQFSGRTVYSLDWLSYDNELEDRSAVIEDNGRILRYNRYVPYEADQKLSRIDLDQAKDVAMTTIKEANPEIAAHVELFEEPIIDLHSPSIQFVFNRVENDLPFYGNNVVVSVNRNDYQIDDYVLTWDYDNGEEYKALSFPKPEDVITIDEAEQAYRENIGILKSLQGSYDRKEQKPKLVYHAMWSTHPLQEEAGINANNGELFFYAPENYRLMRGMAADTATEEAVEPGLTPVELQQVENIKNVHSQSEAEQKLRKAFSIGDQFEATDVNLVKDVDNEDYIYHFNFRQDRNFISGSISGKTLTIFSYDSGDYDNSKEKLTFDEAKEIAVERVKELVPEHADAYQMRPQQETEKQPYFNFTFMRMEDDVWIKNDSIRINIHGGNGKVTSFYMNYYAKDLPAFPKDMTVDEAYLALFEHYPLELQYALDADGNVHLVYALNYKQGVRLDPKDGKPANFYGEPIDQLFCNYEDLADVEHEEEIKTLCQYGIGYRGDMFAPGADLLQRDFIELFHSAIYGRTTDAPAFEDLVQNLINRGLLKEGEVVQGQEPMNKRLAVKMFIREQQLEEVAEMADIYKNIFADSDRLNDDIGYFNIAFAQGIIDKDKAGRIQPDATLTREEGAMLVYHYLFQ